MRRKMCEESLGENIVRRKLGGEYCEKKA